MTTEFLYPIPVYTGQAERFEIIQGEIANAVERTTFVNFQDTHLISEDSFKGDIISQYNLHTLRAEIDRHLGKYCKDIKFRQNIPWKEVKYSFQSAWLTKQEKGHYARMHSHGRCDISGVYYHKTTGEDGHFFMNCPHVVMETTKCYENLAWQTTCVPNNGMIKLFPSWLYHGIRTNTSDDTRISLSFNIDFPDD